METFPDAGSPLLGIYGAGGFGRETARVIQTLQVSDPDPGIPPSIVFIDSSRKYSQANGIPILTEDRFFEIPCSDRLFTIAIASSKVRETLATRMIQRGAIPYTIISSDARVDPTAVLGEGSVIAPFVSVNANAVIGRFVHANLYSYVAHDSVIGDFVTLAPRVSVNGNVHIGDHVYIGTNAVIVQGEVGEPLTVGAGASIGMGALISRPVEKNSKVVGYPARYFPQSP